VTLVTAAHVTWRPLGALLVEKGLLSAEELEDALAAQQTSGKRLGQILVDRGHVSSPALTNALAEQFGIELKTEEGFGTGLRAEIERRHSGRRPSVDAEGPAGSPPEVAPAPEANGGDGVVEQTFEHLPGEVQLAELEPQLEEHWARLAAAEATVVAREARIAEVQSELAVLRSRLDEVAAERDEARRALELAQEAESADGVEDEPKAQSKRSEKVRERELAVETRAAELAARAGELDEQEQAIAGRQRAILTAAADLEERRRSLEEREHDLARRAAEHEQQSNELGRRIAARVEPLEPAHEVVPASSEVREFAERRMPTPPAPAEGYRWNLDTLTRLVEDRADAFPDRAHDWRYTLFYLRNEARIDGALPCRFDALVEECFAELLGSHDGAPLAASESQPMPTL
jgi:DNA repair exonuclease SbcCD ATPase subunit